MINKKAYNFYTTNEIKPLGWMGEQLKLQALGLNGNLDRVWRDIRDSAWIGGDAEGWERVPYWLDGFIPLAYFLNDDELIKRAKKYIDAIIENQNEDGWICPCEKSERRNYDVWAALLICKVLALYADCSGDERIAHVLTNCLRQLNKHLNVSSLRNWGAARWYEGLISIYWLYDKTHEKWLVELANKLQAQGFNWEAIFRNNVLDSCTEGWDYISHVVNLAMMLKSESLQALFSMKETNGFTEMALEYLDKRCGNAFGYFNGDECLSKSSPVSGTELCGVVEAMYSYEIIFSITGDIKWLDRLDMLAFNALPAAISPDMWSHQYDQMVNQVACFPMSKQTFRNNNREAHLFGLEPHFGCCTSNFGQGFPKLLLSSFMAGDKEIVSSVLVPSSLTTKISNKEVKITLDTKYPFRDSLSYNIEVEAPTEFTFSIRIPAYVIKAFVNGDEVPVGKLFSITKLWSRSEKIEVLFQMESKVMKRPNGLSCVMRGPLLYSIPIDERWERVEYEKDGVERKYPYCDYYIFPESKWNYCLRDSKLDIAFNEYKAPFSNEKPPISLYANVAEIEWGFNNGHCDEIPGGREILSEPKKIEMIPYGCTNLRITELPLFDKDYRKDREDNK